MRVLVTDAISEHGLAILRSAGQVEERLDLTKPALLSAIGEFDVLVVRSGTQVDRDVVNAGRDLKIIGRCGVGVDNIDVPAATRRGVLVINSPFGNTEAAAEHAIALLLSMARSIPAAAASMQAGEWDRKRFVGVELHDKVLGVVGFGKIGSAVARRGVGLGMQVLTFDPQVNVARARNLNVEVVSYEELLQRSDFVTYHVPLNRHTRGLLDAERIKLLKRTARVVNCARGGIVDEAALAQALHDGRLAGAAIDVWEHEPPFGEDRSPLLDAPNLIATPHLGASTTEAQENVAVDVARQVLAAWAGEMVQGAVNLPQLEADEHRRLQPYFHLCEQLGRFLAQLSGGGRIDHVDVSYLGQLHDAPTEALTRAVLRGLLSSYYDDQQVNYVNARSVVEEQGIEVTETRSTDVPNYHSLLRVALTTEHSRHVAEGTCFGEEPRVVGLDGYQFNIVPEGYLLIWWNDDRPGVVGRVGTLLGDAGINIAGLQLGRDSIGGRAVSIVEVDSPVAAGILDELRHLPEMRDVRSVEFGQGHGPTNGGGSRHVRPVLAPE